MDKYSGIDLHSNNCVVAVIDADDKVCCESRVANNLSKIIALLTPYRDSLVGIVVESTFNWYWLVDGLLDAGFPVRLANTAAITQYDGLKYSGDEHDARHLAHLLRLNLLRFGYIFPPEWRAVRDLARKRLQMVRSRTLHVLAFETLYARQTGGHIGGDAVKKLEANQVAQWDWLDDAVLAAQANVEAIAAMERIIAQLEKRLHERVKLTPQYAALNTVPGIGEILSTVIMLETGRLNDSRQQGITPRMRAAWGVPVSRTARKKGKAIVRTVTLIWRGHSSKRPISHCAIASQPNASTSAKRRVQMPPWRRKRWRTNWREPVITC